MKEVLLGIIAGALGLLAAAGVSWWDHELSKETRFNPRRETYKHCGMSSHRIRTAGKKKPSRRERKSESRKE